jgi:hypothetical protein
VKSDFLPVDSASIKIWKNDLVEIAPTPDLQRQWANTIKELREKHPGVTGTSYTKGANWELETIHGARLPVQQALPGQPFDPPAQPSSLTIR